MIMVETWLAKYLDAHQCKNMFNYWIMNVSWFQFHWLITNDVKT